MTIFNTVKLILKVIFGAFIVLFCITLIPIVMGIVTCPPPLHQLSATKVPESISSQLKNTQTTIKDYYRPQSSTYLIFPEWYIVYSSREYAEFLKNHLPSGFPYFSSIEQYWCSYSTVNKLTKIYPFNSDDNMMLVVIGISLSVEYTIKGLYENTIGRLTEWLSSNEQVEEDIYAQKVAQLYVDFIPLHPWFEFSFAHSLRGLWHETSWYGPHMIRKWERKIVLSMEYIIKAIYAWLIELGSHQALGVASDFIYASIDHATEELFQKNPSLHKVNTLPNGINIITIPHEQPFTDSVSNLAYSNSNAQFIDIAGNQDILVSALVPTDWSNNLKTGTLLFVMKELTNPSIKRVAIQVPVNSLLLFLKQLQQEKITVEHIYDY